MRGRKLQVGEIHASSTSDTAKNAASAKTTAELWAASASVGYSSLAGSGKALVNGDDKRGGVLLNNHSQLRDRATASLRLAARRRATTAVAQLAPAAPKGKGVAAFLKQPPSPAYQADFLCGKLNGITFPNPSGGIHFAAFGLKLVGTKDSMIFAINHPTCKNKIEAKKLSFVTNLYRCL